MPFIVVRERDRNTMKFLRMVFRLVSANCGT